MLPYSSGTSGRPKGVILTHRNLVANLQQLRAVTQWSTGRRGAVAVLPFFHIYGMTCLLNQGIDRRLTVVTLPRFDLAEFLRVIARVPGAAASSLVPPIAGRAGQAPGRRLLRPVVGRDRSSPARRRWTPSWPGRSRRRLGCRVVQGYGMTEMSPVSHFVPDGVDLDVATVGPLVPNMEAMVVDPATGAELPPGERGELWCRGPNVMAGYLNDPEATAATLDADGWLHTGDLATVDADGVFTIVDRLKELIKYKG